jgi:hypothetical protein
VGLVIALDEPLLVDDAAEMREEPLAALEAAVTVVAHTTI